jgi:H+/Cl- antiporter ClcA
VLVVLLCGALGGLFSRLLAASIQGMPDRVSAYRRAHPVRFAAFIGLAVAIIGMVTGGATFGAGANEVKDMLAGNAELSRVYTLLKLVVTWLTSWSGVPAGIFAPSLSIGASVGNDVAQLLFGEEARTLAPILIALGMASFLAATTQAPLTSFIIVMEMVDGRAMVLSLMAGAMLASLISRLISRPLYPTLSALMIQAVQAAAKPPKRMETPENAPDAEGDGTPAAAPPTKR